MSKKSRNFVISGLSIAQIFLLISSMFAFTFLISAEVEMVSAQQQSGIFSNGVFTPTASGDQGSHTLSGTDIFDDDGNKVGQLGVNAKYFDPDSDTGSLTPTQAAQLAREEARFTPAPNTQPKSGPDVLSLAGGLPFTEIANGLKGAGSIAVVRDVNTFERFAVTSGKIGTDSKVKGFSLNTGKQGELKLEGAEGANWIKDGIATSLEKQYGTVQLNNINTPDSTISLAEVIKSGQVKDYSSAIKEAGYDITSEGARTTFLSKDGSYKVFEDSKEIYNYQAEEKGFLFFKSADPLYGRLLQGLGWAAAAAGVIQLIGGVAGFGKELTNALTYAAAGGIMAGQLTAGLLEKFQYGGSKVFGFKTAGQAGFVTGLAVAAIIFILTYEKKSQEIVTFSCLPFEPLLGGQKCEECNKDLFRPCSEYRCKSLGQACQLLNSGTPNSKCAWVNPKDVTSPTITPWNAALYPSDLRFITDTSVRPPALGVKIVSSAGGCLPAFTPLEFGLTTNEPAQCKLDYNHTKNYESMQFLFGESNYYEYNHTQKMRLPGPDSAEVAGSPLFKNDGTFSLFARCRDANGNENVDEYSVSFCVEKGPDTTPPIIESSSITSGSPVQYNIDKVPMEIYVNEPAQCKWSRESKAYSDMENSMNCASSANEINADLLYTCSGNLTGVENRKDNNYYFRCQDYNNNTMVQSYPLVLKGSQPLLITSIRPNETIFGSNTVVPINLEVVTDDGAEEGKAICYFSNSSNINSFITKFFETNNYLHKQSLTLLPAQYTLYTRCVDAGGNIANRSTTFSVFVDNSAPKITRTYKQLGGLKIVTDEDAQCVYSLSSCNYELKDGINMVYSNPDVKNNHFAEIKLGANYYIKCQDKYGNQPDNPNECSLVVGTKDLIPQKE